MLFYQILLGSALSFGPGSTGPSGIDESGNLGRPLVSVTTSIVGCIGVTGPWPGGKTYFYLADRCDCF